MIIFWTHNDQRRQVFLQNDIVECYQGYSWRREKDRRYRVRYNGRWRNVVPAVVFDPSTEPWTIIDNAQNRHPWAWIAAKHPRFPKVFINCVGGDVIDIAGNVILQGLPMPERVAAMVAADVRSAILATCSPYTG